MLRKKIALVSGSTELGLEMSGARFFLHAGVFFGNLGSNLDPFNESKRKWKVKVRLAPYNLTGHFKRSEVK